jgi:hypothetical protein
VSDENHCIVLGTEMSLLSWGFFFPLYYQEDDKGIRIEVGIESKALQWGPVVTHEFKKFATSLQAALGG